MGERVGVIGLGLVGQLALRIVLAAGCEGIGIDVDPTAVELAAETGALAMRRDDPALESSIAQHTEQLGLDAVLICAGGRSPDPVELAARLARDRGRLVVLGDVAVEADRELLYRKELEIRLSRSYGPGRYDREYEEQGRDLPPGYVRWTEQRNLGAFLQLVASGRLQFSSLTTHRFSVDDAADAYSVLAGQPGERRAFGVLLDYRDLPEQGPSPADSRRPMPRRDHVRIGLIGAGSFARRVLLPALQASGANLVAVATESGLTAADVASRFGFERTSIADEICASDDVDAVVIATRHSTHAALAATALSASKAVFVEKPLALSWDQLSLLEDALQPSSVLFVGFNRRFAPLTHRFQDEIRPGAESILLARVNAGPLPRDHWLNDPSEGGGRLIGEGCHFVDLVTHIAGAPAKTVYAAASPDSDLPAELAQSFSAILRCANGAVCSIVYTANGDASLPKERLEGYSTGVAAVLDDFRQLQVHVSGKKKTIRQRSDNKGHRTQVERFIGTVGGGYEPPPIESYLASTRATLALADSLRSGHPIELDQRQGPRVDASETTA